MFHLKDHLRSQKRILSDIAIDQMQAPSLDAREQQQYGLGWWIENNLRGFHGVLAQGGTSDATAYLQLIPSEDIAVAVLLNTGIGDGNRIVDQVLTVLLPQYRENLAQPGATSQASSGVTQVQMPPTIPGNWSGFVRTYAGTVQLAAKIDTTGEVVAKLGSEPEVRISQARFGTKSVRWTMAGSGS